MKITEESMRQQNNPPEPEPPREPERKRTELEKLKAMSWRDRVWYILEYYKLHMLGAAIVVFILFAIGTSFYEKSFQTAFYCLIFNSRSETGEEVDFAPLQEDFARYLGLGKKDRVNVESLYVSFGEDTSELGYANMAKVSALVYSQDLDIMIGDEDTIRYFQAMNGYVDLEETLPPELLALVEDRLFYAPTEDGTERPCGIDLSGTAFAEKMRLGQTPPLLAIISNSVRRENTDALIRFIFESP